jgi:hypothetical protein
MITQMKAAKLSPWNNKWNDVYDFTPNQGADSKKKNYRIKKDILPSFVTSLEQMLSIFTRIEKARGVKIESLKGKNIYS